MRVREYRGNRYKILIVLVFVIIQYYEREKRITNTVSLQKRVFNEVYPPLHRDSDTPGLISLLKVFPPGVDIAEFSAEKKNVCRVIDP